MPERPEAISKQMAEERRTEVMERLEVIEKLLGAREAPEADIENSLRYD